MPSIVLKQLGQVHAPRTEVIDDFWGNTISIIERDSSLFSSEAVQGLADYSHLLVVYYLDKVPDEKVLWSAGHPRRNKDWPKVGVFAQRKKDRPNKIGVSICELLEVNGLTLRVKALDAIDDTPVLDIDRKSTRLNSSH